MKNIKYLVNKSIFDSNADVLVNTVNCKGTMGKGIAKEFAKRFPECLPAYKKACNSGKLKPGGILLLELEEQSALFMASPSVLLFATKDHWRNPSRLEWIESGLNELAKKYKPWKIKSIAMPQLGCGLGGLNWDEVKLSIEKILGKTKMDIEVYVNDPPNLYSQGSKNKIS